MTPVPVPMIIYCPNCGKQHVDKPAGEWKNPPHRTHLCAFCDCKFRFCDYSTTGVESINTHDEADTWIVWSEEVTSYPASLKRHERRASVPPYKARHRGGMFSRLLCGVGIHLKGTRDAGALRDISVCNHCFKDVWYVWSEEQVPF